MQMVWVFLEQYCLIYLKLLTAFCKRLLSPNYKHMVFIQTHQKLKAYPLLFIKQKTKSYTLMRVVCKSIYYIVFYRDPYWVLSYLKCTYVTYFTFRKTQTLQAMRMILHFFFFTKTKESVIDILETSSSLLFGWFNYKFMKITSDKAN